MVSSNPASFQDDDSDYDYPSNNIPGAEPKDTYDAHSNGVLVDTAEDIFQQELARLKDREQRATYDAERLGLGFAKDAEELQKRASAKTVPPGSIPVPTGTPIFPSGDTMVSPSDVLVPTGGVLVPSGSPTDSFFNAEPTTRFSSPSDLGNNVPSPGIFSSTSYDDEFGADLNNLASNVEVRPVATKQINTDLLKIQAGGLMLAGRNATFKFPRMDGFLGELHEGKYAVWGLSGILQETKRCQGIVVKTRLDVFYQMDVRLPFLYGSIDEEVVKALYGLHQAPKAWYATFSTFLLNMVTEEAPLTELSLKKHKKRIPSLVPSLVVDNHLWNQQRRHGADEFEALMKEIK
ncbi:hypothetical protein Tco_0305561 [Tanacetum coccineum]